MKRIAVIGMGIMGNMHAQIYQNYPKSELVAVCDLIEVRAGSAGEQYAVNSYTDYDTMLQEEDIDAVAVATPDHLHCGPTVASLMSGKDIILEKPMATTIQDCEKIDKAVKASGCKLMINFGNRHRLNTRELKDVIDDGDFGKMKYAYARLSNTIYVPTEMIPAWSGESSAIMFLLPHMADLVSWLFSDEIVEIYAVKTEGYLASKGYPIPDTVTALAKYRNGATACFETAWILPNTEPTIGRCALEVIGEKGVADLDFFPAGFELTIEGKNYEKKGYDMGTYRGRPEGWWYESVKYFIDCLEEGIDPGPGSKEGMHITKVLVAIAESAETGLPVKVV